MFVQGAKAKVRIELPCCVCSSGAIRVIWGLCWRNVDFIFFLQLFMHCHYQTLKQ